MLKKNTKNILKIIGISLGLILIGYLGSMNSKEYYNSLILPNLAPPSVVFPIAWGIIYTLVIASACIIENYVTNGAYKKDAIGAYWLQLIVNVVWPWLFFVFKLNIVSFGWLILLFVLVLSTFLKFYKLNKLAGVFYIPYLLWLVYAGYINLGVALLN